MRTVFSFLKPYRFAAYVALFLMLLELVVELWQPLLMAKIIDDGILADDMSVVIRWGLILIGISILAFASGIINSFFAAHVSQGFGFDARNKLFEKIQAFSFANFNQIPTSSLLTRVTNDVTQVQTTVFMCLRIMLRAPLLVLGGLVMALFVNVKLALILAVTVPLLLLFLYWALTKGRILFQAVQERLDGVNRVMQENLAGMRLVKAYLRRTHEQKRFNVANEQLMDKTVSALRLLEVTMPILLLVMNVSILVILWFGNFELNTTNGVQVGEVVAVVNYATRITGAMTMFSWIIMIFSRARASATRLEEVMQVNIDLLEQKDAKETPPLSGNVKFENVSFRYPHTDTKVLTHLSISIKAGETVALMGATGSGKTSVMQLIPRLYDVDEGRVLVDGIDVETMKLDTLRKQIGYVPQEAILFTGTVKENIAWGKEEATTEEIIEAAKKAQIHETIKKLPFQYETKIGQKGVNLSGGQKQRISIARAFVREPKILLLDDSTSALDLKTEAKLLASLKEYQCTTLLITQKITTAMEADKVILLEDGKVLAEGHHNQLLTSSSLYQKIVQSQSGEEFRNDA
ncbi:ABC transporter ATP-binding protein [Bacillus alkalicellulosilyticus]|uniref:ABC transporter ATP-binding protein n=1 Tax=Alkalihalobacterium alkalicellulosilyticum TaxID=1912214 RepID=UPI000997D25A|nr:ABC transporter ATP-binding protein [Bacillus alkalicellulosilyticus]